VRTVWSEGFTADARDVFSVQERLTQAIVSAVAPTLAGAAAPGSASETQATPGAGTRDPVAYDNYLRARYELNRRGDGVRAAVRLFQQAIARDADFGEAWSGLAAAWGVMPDYDNRITTAQSRDSVRVAYARAIALRPDDWEAYAALGITTVATGEFAEGIRQLKRATELGPRASTAYRWLGVAYGRAGLLPEAVAALREAVALDPLAAGAPSNLSYILALDPATRDEARLVARRAVSIDPSNIGAASNASIALHITGDFAESQRMLDRVPFEARSSASLGLTAGNLVALGQADSARALLSYFQRQRGVNMDAAIAMTAAALGQWDLAFSAMEPVVQDYGSIDAIVTSAPLWQPVAGDPRMRALCARTRVRCDALLPTLTNAVPLPGR
jgi:adenylate cyclase